MSNVLKHRFVSPKLDGSDLTQVQPSAWNDGHQFSGGLAGDLLTRDPTDATYGAKWTTPVEQGWIAYQPNWYIGGVGQDLANHTLTGVYFRRGNAVWFQLAFTVGSAALPAGSWAFSRPVSGVATSAYAGNGILYAGTSLYPVSLNAGFEPVFVYPQVMTSPGLNLVFVSSTVPVAIVAGNRLECRGNYQAA